MDAQATNMDIGTVLSIVSIIISVTLSVGAILLSLWFYKESNKQNRETAIMQVEIKEAVQKLEKIYDKTYTDTFAALRNQMDAMQRHIFSSSIGHTNTEEPNQLKFYVLGCVSQTDTIEIEELYKQITGFDRGKIVETVYAIHREGIIQFDGKTIKKLKLVEESKKGQGDGVTN